VSDAGTIIVNDPAGPLGFGPRFDQAASELLIAVRLAGEKPTVGTAHATQLYAASDPVVTPSGSHVSP